MKDHLQPKEHGGLGLKDISLNYTKEMYIASQINSPQINSTIHCRRYTHKYMYLKKNGGDIHTPKKVDS